MENYFEFDYETMETENREEMLSGEMPCDTHGCVGKSCSMWHDCPDRY